MVPGRLATGFEHLFLTRTHVRGCIVIMSALMLGQRSFDDLGTPLREATFCVLDLETTGGSRNDDMITEIGAVKVRGGECVGTFHTLVNPGRAIPPQITVLTGLTDAVVQTAPRIESVLGSLVDFLGDAVFVAHNAPFDLGFVRAALARDNRNEYRPTVVATTSVSGLFGEMMMRATLLNRASLMVLARGVQVSPRSIDLKIPLPFMVSML